jgi:hypothetical protein
VNNHKNERRNKDVHGDAIKDSRDVDADERFLREERADSTSSLKGEEDI